MNWVAPLPKEARSRAGLVKNIFSVSRKPAFGCTAPTARPSSPPRRGSRTTKTTAIAATIPTAPTTRKASRQLKAAAIEAPKAMPKAAPMGGPRL